MTDTAPRLPKTLRVIPRQPRKATAGEVHRRRIGCLRSHGNAADVLKTPAWSRRMAAEAGGQAARCAEPHA